MISESVRQAIPLEAQHGDGTALRGGMPPSVGTDHILGFLEEHYLKSYIMEGGSKIKMLTGRRGAGKTHVSGIILERAAALNYLTVHFSAKDVWLHDFQTVFLEIMHQCGIEEIIKGCADQIIRNLGYDPAQIPEGRTFIDYLSEMGEADAISKGAIRSALRTFFTKNPLLDNNFAVCCSLLTGGILGHPVLESASRELLLEYLSGDKTVKLSMLRALGLSPSRITKYNARHMLRSLSQTAKLGGFSGIVVVIDDMEILLNRASGTPIHYARGRREDAYESIRQLIDDIDSMGYLMFFLCFDRELMENESYGLRSYQALWMRVQNEIVSGRFNCFADLIDLDRYGDQYYTPDVLVEMSAQIAKHLAAQGRAAYPVDLAGVQELMERARYGGLGLPYLVEIKTGEPPEDQTLSPADKVQEGGGQDV